MKIVKVEWKDTCTLNGWDSEPLETSPILSVGWIVRKTRSTVELAGMKHKDTIDYNCRQAIPRGCIISIKELEE